MKTESLIEMKNLNLLNLKYLKQNNKWNVTGMET